ncbi:MAG TPA: tetratricopeptide repeat protein [Kofleriaceae bacterium]
MKSRSLVIATLAALAVVTLAGTATAAPRHPGPPGPPLTPHAGKLDKKQLEIERHIWTAQFYLRKAGDLPGAIREYKAVLALDPANTPASLALASLYRSDKKPKLALDVLTRLTKKAPANPDAWLLLAQLQAELKDDAAMKASIARVIALDPESVGAYALLFDRAQARLDAGDAAAKADALDAARKIMAYTRHQGAMYKLAERAVIKLSGQPIDVAVYDAKAAYAAAFDSPEIGLINEHMAVARRGFAKCLQLDPGREDCHYQLGLVYSSVKASDAYDPGKALAELAAAPSLPAAWIQAAVLLRAADKPSEARAALDKALALDRRSAVAHVELGILDKLDGKTDAAAEHFVAALDADPYGAAGDRALGELAKVRPNHPRVVQSMLEGRVGGDVFSSDRYKAAVGLMEQELGGIDDAAPEKAVIEDIVHKLLDASAVKQQFRVSLLTTGMVNAFALPDGHVYVTRGLIDLMKKKQPGRPIDAGNDALGHILGHELQHVLRRHNVNSAVFQAAIKDASSPLDPSVLTHITRLQEMDADREGMVMAFLAGFHPRGGIEFMEIMGKELEIPQHLDHPTFDERVAYLTEYWTNDVRYAFVSFRLGVAAMDKGAKLEASDMKQAVSAYDEAIEDFKRYHAMLPSLKEADNDLGIAYTKLGVLAMSADSPLARWQTRFSLERASAVAYVGLARGEESGQTRGGDKARLPPQLREAIAAFKEALSLDETYSKARLNLAAAYLAANQLDNASAMLAKVEARDDVTSADIDLIRGIALAEARTYDKARAAFEHALTSQSARRAAAYNLAKTLELAGKAADAKRAYQQYTRLYPGGPWAKAADAAAAKL